MTPLERIIDIVGTQTKLAEIIGCHYTNVTHWARLKSPLRRETLPFKYNDALTAWASANLPPEKAAELAECLEHVCPTCHRPY